MTHLGLFALLRLVGEDCDLLSLAVLEHLGFNGCTCNVRSSDSQTAFCADCDYLVKAYCCVSLYLP